MDPKPVLPLWRFTISLFLSHLLLNECSRLSLVLNIVFCVIKVSLFISNLLRCCCQRKPAFFLSIKEKWCSRCFLESVVEKNSKFRIRSQTNNSAIVSFYYGLSTFVKRRTVFTKVNYLMFSLSELVQFRQVTSYRPRRTPKFLLSLEYLTSRKACLLNT